MMTIVLFLKEIGHNPLLFSELFVFLQQKQFKTIVTSTAMDTTNMTKKWTREDFLALIERGRQIKEKRMKEAQAKYAERQRRKKEAVESGYYDLEWV